MRLIFLLLVLLHLIMFLIGSVKFKDCPVNNYIPFYLIVAGELLVILNNFGECPILFYCITCVEVCVR